MQFPDLPTGGNECPICRAALSPDSAFCSECGTRTEEASTAELRAVLYLLSELERWRAEGAISRAEAAALSLDYERRRDELRALLASNAEAGKSISPVLEAGDAERAERELPRPADVKRAANASSAGGPDDRPSSIPFTIPRQQTQPPPIPPPQFSRPRRALLETLAEPYTLRLLLYTGAAMFVVGIVIWLRDVLYLKLQEPLVQAGLLMAGTIAFTASGWYTILRTRQRLTGRALTLTGSLLVPVNFWFLVRSGLIENRGRAWVVCAFCALLYAHTAALLGEKLYVYLACAASVGVGWALVYVAERDAPGLYALVLMVASLVFLHLSRLFPKSAAAAGEARERDDEDELADEAEAGRSARATADGLWSYELWSGPLVGAALVGALLCALVYMPLRLGPSLSLYDGIFRLRARGYDSSMAMVLFTGIAYIAWFTGRYVAAGRRVTFYTLAALALLWTQFLTMDGLRLSAAAQIAGLAMTALVVSLAARVAQDLKLVRALYLSGVIVCAVLVPVAFAALLGAEAFTFLHGAGFALLACSFAALSAPRLCERAAQSAFGYAAALLASTAFLVALLSASINSVTLFTALCASWPIILYAVAMAARGRQREAQLSAPLARTADAEVFLLLLWASLVALALYLVEERPFVPRAAVFCALFAAFFYGTLRAARERSTFGASVASFAAVVIVASSFDALQRAGLWPRAWPIAGVVICAAFALRRAAAKWFPPDQPQAQDGGDIRSPLATIRLMMDGAVISCALLWFITSLALFERGVFGAAWVLGLALVYWGERAALRRRNGLVYFAAAHALAFFITLLVALGTDERWFAALIALVPVPVFFMAAGYARARAGAAWLALPVGRAAVAAMALAWVAALLQAMPHLQAGDSSLLAPSVAMGALALISMVVSMISKGFERVRFFRAGLYLGVIAYALACLRSGFEPLVDVEIYTSPVALLLIAVAYVSFRREWDDYESDASLLFWAGSILLAGPLLLRALQFRLLLDLPAPSRDLATLCASLALLLFGILGRLRAPVLAGAVALLIELMALALTSVDWLQVPLKIYLVTVGALLALVGWMFEYRREQLILIRNRFNARREMARERFGEWR